MQGINTSDKSKILLNSCYGGFGFSDEFAAYLEAIQCLLPNGEKSKCRICCAFISNNSPYSEWHIEEYDGSEGIETGPPKDYILGILIARGLIEETDSNPIIAAYARSLRPSL